MPPPAPQQTVPSVIADLPSFMMQLRALHEAAGAGRAPAGLRFADFCACNHKLSRAQFFQDLFVLFVLGGKTGGYFVEFGACDGVFLSNTKLLEEKLGWTGLLAEPARRYHEALRRNRTCAIDLRCVYSRTGETLSFHEADVDGLSSLSHLAEADYMAERRRAGRRYDVGTVSLNDLLADHAAPFEIDYLSLDTEGSEFDILAAFDFSRHRFGVITVEHNHTAAGPRIRALLEPHGYLRLFPEFSEVDDWFVHSARLAQGSAG